MRNQTVPRRASSYRWVILVFGTLAYATTLFSRQNYAGVQKFIAADLQLDSASLGLLGAIFFYAYALFQIPWGIASDRFGSRGVTVVGVALTAGAMVGFASARSEHELFFWRALSGVAGAAVYVAMAGGIARWFPREERGFSQATLAGAGGAAGEATAFFLLPVISIHFASGWRQGTTLVAVGIGVIALLCLIFLRSVPPHDETPRVLRFDARLLGDPRLWCYTFLFAGFIVGLRIVQPWIALYAADVYITTYGLNVNEAVIKGGILTIVAYSLLGRGVGCGLAGKLSDALVKRGITRAATAIGWLLFAVVLLQILSAGTPAVWSLAIAAFLLGVSINLFSLISAAISEAYGTHQTASILSFVNTISQLLGATALAVSGYVGISLRGESGNALAVYRGIWLAAAVGVSIMTLLGGILYIALRMGWVRSALSVPPGAQEG